MAIGFFSVIASHVEQDSVSLSIIAIIEGDDKFDVGVVVVVVGGGGGGSGGGRQAFLAL
jgi:hypothetical protein